jgi:NAD(P)-dependent dehydrogenase (short-subunit alcohol dehydrogenase family)
MVPTDEYTPISELITLTNKRAVVTGGAMGIGFAISYRLAEAGASIVIVDVDSERAEKASEKLRSNGYEARFIQADVSREKEVRDTVNTIVEDVGGIDILVNNAGIYPYIPFAQITGDDIDRVVSVNLKGTLLCSREVSSNMIQQRQSGCIINIASISSSRPVSKGFSIYDASKGGVHSLTKSMALELGQHSIRVNAIGPGSIMTEGMLSQGKGLQPSEWKAELKKFMASTVLGRLGRADDIGRVALFLASDLASYVTGTLTVVDGGFQLTGITSSSP